MVLNAAVLKILQEGGNSASQVPLLRLMAWSFATPTPSCIEVNQYQTNSGSYWALFMTEKSIHIFRGLPH